MNRVPVAIGGSAFLATAMGSLTLASSGGNLAPSSVAMVVLGVTLVSLGGLAGLLLVRAPWSRWVLGAAVVMSALLASATSSPMFWITLLLGAVAIIGLTGPWLGLWVRQAPIADPIGPVPSALLAGGAVAPVVVGLASIAGVITVHWIFVISVAMSGWAYGRGLPFGIWSLRTVVPIIGLAAAFVTPLPGVILIIAGTILLAGLAWSPGARRVTAVITPPLPPPVRRKGE